MSDSKIGEFVLDGCGIQVGQVNPGSDAAGFAGPPEIFMIQMHGSVELVKWDCSTLFSGPRKGDMQQEIGDMIA